jgi:hypothetical protein
MQHKKGCKRYENSFDSIWSLYDDDYRCKYCDEKFTREEVLKIERDKMTFCDNGDEFVREVSGMKISEHLLHKTMGSFIPNFWGAIKRYIEIIERHNKVIKFCSIALSIVTGVLAAATIVLAIAAFLGK